MRKLMRSIARHNMQRAEIVQMNKKIYTPDDNGNKRSKFSRLWREYVNS